MEAKQAEERRLQSEMRLTKMRILLLERQRDELMVAYAARTPEDLVAALDAINATYARRRIRY